jgi:AbrB family looped-hinge helix DNA binding protein
MREGEAKRRIVRPLRGGQITIPAEFRAKLGIDRETLLQVTLSEGELRIRPVTVTEGVGDSAWVKELYDLFGPVRDDMEQYSEEEIDADIEKSLDEVRARRD